MLKKFTEEEIKQTGLFYKNEKNNKFVDRFHSRIIFPIKNIVGDVVAFGGRIIKESQIAKYINSPETEFYKKGKHIFNLEKVKSVPNKTQEVIVVEGYMDVVSMHSFGIRNVVSNQGTALTESQINLIWKFFNNVILCLDGDVSGQKASLRIAEHLFSFIKENNNGRIDSSFRRISSASPSACSSRAPRRAPRVCSRAAARCPPARSARCS